MPPFKTTPVEAPKAVVGIGGAIVVVRSDVLPITLTPPDGDFTFLRVDKSGALWIKASEPIQVGANLNTVGTSFVPTTARLGSQFNLSGTLTFVDILRIDDGTGLLRKVLLTDTQGICPDLDLVILSAAPTGSAGSAMIFLDNANYVRQGIIPIRVDDWEFSTNSAIASPSFEPFPVEGQAGNKDLFGVLITKQSVQWQGSNTFRVFIAVENN